MPLRTIATGLLVGLVLLAPSSASPQRLETRTADPLVGTWDTAAISLAKVRAALTAAGYDTFHINKMFGTLRALNHITKSVKYEIQFYRDSGRPYQIIVFWDPATQPKPSNAGFDHGPYKLLPGHRLALRGVDPPTDTYVTTYSYTVTGKRLGLHFVRLVEPGQTAKQVLADRKWAIAKTVGQYAKVGS